MPAPNGGHRHLDQVGAADRDRTVITYLASRYPLASEGEWLRRIESGEVILDSFPGSASPGTARPGSSQRFPSRRRSCTRTRTCSPWPNPVGFPPFPVAENFSSTPS